MVARPLNCLRHFRFLWNRWTESWQEGRPHSFLTTTCFWGRSGKNMMATLTSDFLQHFPQEPLTRIWLNLTRSMYSMPSTTFVFFGRSKNKDNSLGWTVEKGTMYIVPRCSICDHWALSFRLFVGIEFEAVSCDVIILTYTYQQGRYFASANAM